MTANWDLHPAHIRNLAVSDTRDMDAPTSDWVEALNNIIEARGLGVLVAWTHAQEDHDSGQKFGADTLDDAIERTFQGAHETAAKFAEHIAEGETEMGDPEEAKGRAWFFEKYGRYTNWQEFAESPEIAGTYSLIMLDPENSREVHAFNMEA